MAVVESLVHLLLAFNDLTMDGSGLKQIGVVIIVEMHLTLLENLGLRSSVLMNFLQIVVFLLKLGVQSNEMPHLLLGVLLLVVLNIKLGVLAGLLRIDHIRSVLHVASPSWNLLRMHLKNVLFFVTHFVDDEFLVFLNLMEYLGTTLLQIKRTSLILVLDLVLKVILLVRVDLVVLMHILVFVGNKIRFISDVIIRSSLLEHMGGNRWTHVLVRIFLQTLEGRI